MPRTNRYEALFRGYTCGAAFASSCVTELGWLILRSKILHDEILRN